MKGQQRVKSFVVSYRLCWERFSRVVAHDQNHFDGLSKRRLTLDYQQKI
jgi:hypothetical protein